MPKQNRPLVRDGRIQARKKRTDRSYLQPGGSATGIAEEAEVEDNLPEATAPEDVGAVEEAASASEAASTESAAGETVLAGGDAPEAATPVSNSTAAPGRVNGATASTNGAAAGRLTGTARALQQQGIRKRREFDVEALAIRDSKYAMHEMRRIATLAVLVIITLVVLSLILR